MSELHLRQAKIFQVAGHSSNPFDADGSGAYGASGATAADRSRNL